VRTTREASAAKVFTTVDTGAVLAPDSCSTMKRPNWVAGGAARLRTAFEGHLADGLARHLRSIAMLETHADIVPRFIIELMGVPDRA
jgi:hypothetical protein